MNYNKILSNDFIETTFAELHKNGHTLSNLKTKKKKNMTIWKKEIESYFELMYEDGMKLSFIESEIKHHLCQLYDENEISADELTELEKHVHWLLYEQ